MDGTPRTGWSADRADPLASGGQAFYGGVGGEDLVHRQCPLAVDHHQPATAVVQAVHVQVDRLVVLAIEVDKSALSQSHSIGQRHARSSDLGPDTNLDVHEGISGQKLLP